MIFKINRCVTMLRLIIIPMCGEMPHPVVRRRLHRPLSSLIDQQWSQIHPSTQMVNTGHPINIAVVHFNIILSKLISCQPNLYTCKAEFYSYHSFQIVNKALANVVILQLLYG